MRIPCPCCGERDVREFSCFGDAGPLRPAADDEPAFFDYVYLRTNPAGLHNELWYHAAGCHSWLVVTRNTITHEISSVVRAADRQAQ
jgi:sarcosine oxidase subunit delta